MQAVLGTFEHYSPAETGKLSEAARSLWNKIGEVFGCPHKEMSRPFSRQGESYRVCINCGAHRRFDAQNWNMSGPYYFKAASTSNLLETNVSSLRRAA